MSSSLEQETTEGVQTPKSDVHTPSYLKEDANARVAFSLVLAVRDFMDGGFGHFCVSRRRGEVGSRDEFARLHEQVELIETALYFWYGDGSDDWNICPERLDDPEFPGQLVMALGLSQQVRDAEEGDRNMRLLVDTCEYIEAWIARLASAYTTHHLAKSVQPGGGLIGERR